MTPQECFKLRDALHLSVELTGAFGTLLGTMPMKVLRGRDDEMMRAMGIDTAFTDGTQICFLESFLEKLDKSSTAFVMLHEAAHVALHHLSRRGKRDPRVFNWACDTVINHLLSRISHNPPMVDGNPTGIGFGEDTKDWFVRFAHKSEETIYSELIEELTQKQKQQQKNGKGKDQPGQGQPEQGQGQSGQGQGGQGQPGQPGEGEPSEGGSPGEGEPGENDKLDDHIGNSKELREALEKAFGEEGKALADQLGAAKTKEEVKAAEERMRRAVSQAAMRARRILGPNSKSQGGHLTDFVEEAIAIDHDARHKNSWTIEVNGLLERHKYGRPKENPESADEFSILTSGRRTRAEMGLERPVFIPRLERHSSRGRLAVVLDTSGSMSDAELAQGYVELRGVIEENDCVAYVYNADTEVRGERIQLDSSFATDFPTEIKVFGRGGTDMCGSVAETILDMWERREKPDALILITDGGYGAFSESDLRSTMSHIAVHRNLDVSQEDVQTRPLPPGITLYTREAYCSDEHKRAAETYAEGWQLLSLDSPISHEVTIDQDGLNVQ